MAGGRQMNDMEDVTGRVVGEWMWDDVTDVVIL